ncbi:PAS domain S-box-containing protein/diguanylate cyclase (GGDEF) domain-containing protein [Pseudomonas linyingensis]|uniref:PAS domain S-box-containing protein/diguanylate cyclase (GGDEF) domain-containing protein n=1 Tax=Pseudomonas linyingensis TaxID=915471 RepID=A0A1H6TC94_9PSED|nr:diguanylate cyclase [Pseudomonas linyingensis]SEI77689.1 PAS domain S-box-containing protein/diguanylate cyclase (GGDEF) domain-containing protein [Pseudomonas linyingensis]
MLTSAPPDAASPQIASRKSPDATPPVADERFDGLTRLAKRHFGVAVALIMRIDADRQRLVSCAGPPGGQKPGDLPFSEHSLFGDGMLVVPDTHTDERFRHHPLVIDNPCMRFYAACPLLAADGSTIGVFVLLDDQPQALDGGQRECFRDLARLAAASVESDRAAARLQADTADLRDRERRMALAIAGSGTGIWDRNVQTGEIHYSSGWKAILGYADAEVGNRIEDSYQRIHPDDLAYVQATIQAHFEGKTEGYAVEHRIRCKDGRYKWISSRGKVVSRDREGRPLRMIGTTTDITAMHALSERLQQSVDLLTNLTNEVPGLVFQYRRWPTGESLFSYASAGIQSIYEVTPEQVADSDAMIDALIHPDDLPAYRAALDASATSLTPWDLEYRVRLPRQGLRWRHGAAQPRRLEDGSTLWHGFITDVTERKRIEAELLEFATTDFLTQLPNRRHLMTQIEAELARMQRSAGHCAAVLMCDLDHFKSINDRWGHATGDLALRHFADILRAQLRKSDMAGRVGGEEFAVILSGANLTEATAFARRVQQQLAQNPLQHGDQCIAMTLSIGIAVLTASDTSVDAALSRSDMALYRAKSSGRNRIECL